MKKEESKGSKQHKSGNLIDRYEIESEGMRVDVNIVKGDDKVSRYILLPPCFTKPTLALMDEIKKDLISEISISAQEVLDISVIKELKLKIREKTIELLKKHVPDVNNDTKIYIIGTMIHNMMGLGDIEFLLSDPDLEEIRINSASEYSRVYHKKYGWLETNTKVLSEAEIQNYADIIARRVGKQINVLYPLLDAHLLTGDRVNVVLYPITTKGNTVTIRKFARDPWTVTDLLKINTVTPEVMSLIWIAMEYEMNILISGGTGSGKTSFLNVCLPFIPPNQSIMTIEDTRELQLPNHLYWTPMVTRVAGSEGKGEVSMLDLLINSLRMRPDRIIMGEVRRKAEAEVMFEAMHTGHSVYATIHADSISETVSRLVNPPISVPKNLLGTIDLCAVMFRDRRKGIRRLYQVGELIAEGDDTDSKIVSNTLFRWKPTTDKIAPHSNSLRLFEDLSRNTGMTQKEINSDLSFRSDVLNWLVKNNIRNINEVGKVMKEFYIDRQMLADTVSKNLNKDRILRLEE